jgi:NADH pyrophosphatase NudC (nudix superfamily)
MNIDPNPNDGDIVFCPRCGTKNTEEQDSHPNGGDLYVAEDCGSSTEYHDGCWPYKCLDCETRFYIGDD